MSIRQGNNFIAGTPDVTGKANTDLSNLSSTGQKVIDGQWVPLTVQLAEGVSQNTSSDTDYDISSYLPNDNYNYELLVDGNCTTGSSSGNISLIALITDLLSQNVLLCRINTRSSSSVQTGGSIIIPVGSSRVLTKALYANNTGVYSLRLKGYRRIGTNS